MKALPRPSKRFGETVCCAGITVNREWRRLYPIRYRQLGDKKFQRWQWIRYGWRLPTSDVRKESRHVFEDSITPVRKLPERERPDFLEPLMAGSVREAASRGDSLTLIRPQRVSFRWRGKSEALIAQERDVYRAAARQMSFLDQELADYEPCPYDFRLSFVDEDGQHHHTCADWETSATFWRQSRKYDAEAALSHLNHMYNELYPERGMVLAMGNLAKRPQTWQLLGIIRLDPSSGPRLFP